MSQRIRVLLVSSRNNNHFIRGGREVPYSGGENSWRDHMPFAYDVTQMSQLGTIGRVTFRFIIDYDTLRLERGLRHSRNACVFR
ncbi:hypothetical protein ES702_01124 [subsurface metagenome]